MLQTAKGTWTMKKIFLSLLVLFGAANSSIAVEIPAMMKNTMAQDPIGLPSLIHLVVSMAVVIGLIYVTGWIYAKLNIVNREKLNKLTKEEQNSKFTVLQTMPLGQQRHLYSIEMNGKILLVGSTPSHINLLKEFDKECMTTSAEKEVIEPAVKQERHTIKTSVDIDELYKKYKN